MAMVRGVRRPSVIVRPHFQSSITLKSFDQFGSNFMLSIIRQGERLLKVFGLIGLEATYSSHRLIMGKTLKSSSETMRPTAYIFGK